MSAKFQQSMDWHTLIERAKEWGVERCVYFTCDLANQLIGSNTPKQVMDALEDPTLTDNLRDLAIGKIFPPEKHGKPVSINLARFLSARSINEKLDHWLRAAIPSRKFLARKYPVDPISRKSFCIIPSLSLT